MKKMLVPLLLAFSLLVAGATARLATVRETGAAPERPTGFASPINGGCYVAAEGVCKIHIDPFTININEGAGASLEFFTLYANGNPIYSFRTDISNPPRADYSPSLVMEDFAAECGQTYVVNLVAKDTSDANPLNYGQTGAFTCPSTVP